MRYVGLLFLCIWAGCSSGGGVTLVAGAASINGADVRVDLFRVGGIVSEVAAVTVPFAPVAPTQRVANAVVDFNDDGMIADYSAGGPTQEEWILRNLPLVVAGSERSAYFRLVDVAVAAAVSVRVRIVLSDAELPAAPQLGGGGGDVFEGDVTVFVSDREDLATPAAGFIGTGSGTGSENEWLNETAGEDLDLDSFLSDGDAFYRPGLPDVPQSANTCVLHAIAGSVSWLARANGFDNKVNDANALVDVATLEGVNELAFQIDDVGQMGYTPANGVGSNVVLAGKERYVQAKKLPIATRQVTTNIFAETQQALKDGCTVELVMTFSGGGGHMVSVAGYSTRNLPGGGTARTLTLHDSNTRTFNDTYDVTGTDKLMKFPFRNQLQEATLDFAIIECYKPFLIPTQEDAGLDGRVPVPCLVIGGRNYPIYQFGLSNNPMDVCGEPHWHSEIAVFPLDPPAGGTGELTDPDGDGCGFGTEKQVPQSLVRIPFSEFSAFLAAHPHQ